MSPPASDGEIERGPGHAVASLTARQRSHLQLLPPFGIDFTAAERPEQAERLDLLAYWRILLKHRWLILSCIAAALLIGLGATLLMHPVYTSASTLQIDREEAKVVNKGEGTPVDNMVEGEEFFQTQYGLLRSRSLTIRVAESLGLTRDDAFILAMGARPRAAAATDPQRARTVRREQVLVLLRKNLAIMPNRGSRLVTIAFRSPQPDLSARIANAFAENFIAAALDRRYESSSYARDFLEKRLAEVKAKLEDTERQLVAYAASQQIIQLNDAGQGTNPGVQQSLAAANLQSLSTALSAAKAARAQAEAQWRQAQATPGMGLPEILGNPTIQQISQDRAKLGAQYEQNLRVFKPDYPDMLQLKAQIAETDRQLGLEAANIRKSIQVQYQSALANERALGGQVNGLKGDVLDLSKRSIQYTILQREVDTNRTLYDGLLQRYKEVGVAGGVTTNNISVVDRAEPPFLPSSPKPLLNFAIALVAGAAAGIGLAFLREALDQAIRTPADVEAKIGLPLLGAIPVLKAGIQPAEALADLRSGLSEAYQSLRSALQFSTKDGFPKTMLVTSPKPGDGKSTTAVALAQNVARLGFRTLLVDGDLRNSSLHKLIGADNRVGLSNVLTGAARLSEVVQAGRVPNLYIVTSGPLPPNPAELLAGGRLQAFIGEAQNLFDMVIFDGPPIMGLADAPLISAAVGGTVMVLEAGLTGRTQVRAALRRLAMARGHLLGAVLTKFNAKAASYGYGYGYQYDYDYGRPAAAGAAARGILSRRRAPRIAARQG